MPEASALRVRPGARTETALCRLAQDAAGLSGWRRYGLAFGLGALLAGALPPFDLTPLVFIAYAVAWVALAFYVFTLVRKVGKLETDLAELRKAKR